MSLGWMGDALCATLPWDELTVPEQMLSCSRCPVAAPCLDYALALPGWGRHDYDGEVYAGYQGADLRRLRRERRSA